jgi:outer membrane protein OmpA-like peptidoglycan-associated protein
LNNYQIGYTFNYSDGLIITPLHYGYNFLEYSEKHKVGYLNIPVLFGLQFSERYYAMLGTKIGLNLIGNYTNNALVQTIVTDPKAIEGWTDIFDPISYSSNGSLKLGLNATASAEFGVILDEWLPRGMTQLNNQRRTPISYRVGAFVDYGLLNLNKSTPTNPLIFPNATNPLELNFSDLSTSVLASDKRFGNLYAGIKLTVLFQASRNRRPTPPPVIFYAQVVDSETRSPLDAEVTLRSANRQVFKQQTDSDGFVSHELRTGRYTVNAQTSGYTPYRQSVTHNKLDTLLIALQPISILTVHVIDVETKENLRADVTVSNTALPNNPQVFSQSTDAASGMLNYELRAGKYQLSVTAEDYIYHQEAFDFTRTETKTVALQPIKKDVVVVLEDLFFAVDRSEILPESEPTLEDLSQFLSQNPSIHIHIVGHTDITGTLAHNMTLSNNRAKAVYDSLVSKGIDASRLTFEGRGPTDPIATNDTEEGRAKNRRVEFVIK